MIDPFKFIRILFSLPFIFIGVVCGFFAQFFYGEGYDIFAMKILHIIHNIVHHKHL